MRHFVFLPDMLNVQIQFDTGSFDHLSRFFSTAIVGDQQLEILESLMRESPQDFLQPIGCVVRTGYNGEFQRPILSGVWVEPAPVYMRARGQ